MAYDLDSMMAASNDALRRSQEQRPVIPNPNTNDRAGSPDAYAPANSDPVETDQSGAVIGGSPFSGLFKGLNADTAASYGPDVQGGRPVGAPMNDAPVIAPAVTQTRTAPVSTPASPLSTAASEAPGGTPQSVPVGYQVQTYGSSPSGAPAQQPDYAGQLSLIRAQDAQAHNDNLAAMRDQGTKAQASFDQDRARGEARVANWNAEMARLDVAGNIGGPGNEFAAAKAAENANAARANVDKYDQVIRGPAPAPANPLDSQLKIQQANAQGQQAQTANALGQSQLQTQQQALAQQKRLTDLGGQLAGESDPAKRQQLQDSILTLLGKEKGDRYKVIHAAGGEVLGPDGFSRIKQPDSIVVHDSQTGKVSVLPLGGQAPAAGNSKYVEGQTYTDKNGNKAVYKNGQFVPA